MRRYARVYLAFVRNCLVREMEFRAHFWFMSVTNALWGVMSLALIGFVFGRAGTVAGWDLDRVIVLTGTFFVVWQVAYMLFYENMAKLSQHVNRGELDLILVKPLDSQFLVSTRYIKFNELMGLVLGFGYVAWGLLRLGYLPPWWAVVAWGGYVVAAIVMIYALWFLSVSFTIWVGRINNIHFLVEPFMELARVPSDVYQGLLRVLFTFALPLAFVATVPTRALLGVFDPLFAGYGLALALGLLWLSHWWWNVALRRYASASS